MNRQDIPVGQPYSNYQQSYYNQQPPIVQQYDPLNQYSHPQYQMYNQLYYQPNINQISNNITVQGANNNQTQPKQLPHPIHQVKQAKKAQKKAKKNPHGSTWLPGLVVGSAAGSVVASELPGGHRIIDRTAGMITAGVVGHNVQKFWNKHFL